MSLWVGLSFLPCMRRSMFPRALPVSVGAERLVERGLNDTGRTQTHEVISIGSVSG